MEKIDSNEKYVPKGLLTTRNIIVLIIGLLTAFNTLWTGMTSNKLEIQSKTLEQALRKKEFENELRFRVFEEVKKAISGAKSDSSMRDVVSVIVDQMLIDDTAFQERMKTILMASRNTPERIKDEIRNSDQFKVEQQQLVLQAQKSPDNTEVVSANSRVKFRVDVFYLEDKLNESSARAETVRAKVKAKFPNYDVRVRLLPRSVNASQGYRIDSNQVRFEGSEKNLATEIKQLLESANILPDNILNMMQTTYSTPNYVSVFIL